MGARGAKGAGATGARGAKGAGATGARAALLACLLACVVGCAQKTAPVSASPTAVEPAPAVPAAAPVVLTAPVELPDGPGSHILNYTCDSCHNLTEVTKFRGFYTRSQWRDIVQTMVDYGAPVNDTDAEVLTAYLTETLGKK